LQAPCGIDVKKHFYVFFIFVTFFYLTFYIFNVFLIFQTFFLFLENVGKVQSGKQINKKALSK